MRKKKIPICTEIRRFYRNGKDEVAVVLQKEHPKSRWTVIFQVDGSRSMSRTMTDNALCRYLTGVFFLPKKSGISNVDFKK